MRPRWRPDAGSLTQDPTPVRQIGTLAALKRVPQAVRSRGKPLPHRPKTSISAAT